MDDVFSKEENQKNIYVIKHKLAELKKGPYSSDWEWHIGDFRVVIKAVDQDYWSARANKDDNVVKHEKLDVTVFEMSRLNVGTQNYVNLRDDSRFKKYKPIQYNVLDLPGGPINLSDGSNMPLINLCELIRYLHRLSNLTAFL